MDVEPIGRVSSPRTEPLDDDWDAITATITLDSARFTPDALSGLESFSHVEVVYVLDRVDPDTVQTRARRPRGNTDWPEVGIFAQRARGRPNRIYMEEFAPRGEVRQPLWSRELMAGYWHKPASQN